MLEKSHFASTTKLPEEGEYFLKVLLCHLVARIETASFKHPLKRAHYTTGDQRPQETRMGRRARPWWVRDDRDSKHIKCVSAPGLSKSCCRHTVLVTERQSRLVTREFLRRWSRVLPVARLAPRGADWAHPQGSSQRRLATVTVQG